MDYKELQDRFSRLSVLVCGDMCLDKDLIGGYSGFSREVEQLPIFRTEIEKYNPGGGGNLSVCFSSLGVTTIIAGMWGDEEDYNRYILEQSFRRRNIDTRGMVKGSRTPTYGKIYLRNGVHIYRFDLVSEAIPESALNELAGKIKDIIPLVDFIACADYEEANDYGVCSEKVLEVVTKSEMPKFGTSRARISRFKNFDHLLQNTKELADQSEFDKETDLPIIVENFIKELKLKEIVVTMGGKGATVFCLNSRELENMSVGSVEIINKNVLFNSETLINNTSQYSSEDITSALYSLSIMVETDEKAIIDPCGCGDMFYAAYATSIMAGYDTETSIKIANSAARVVARKLFGTGQATPEEIVQEYAILYS
jgi:bifunctional ADP-heptose synthase (sugar kinase/adenylyltransferase)